MKSSSSSSRDCARTRCGWKAATPHLTLTAIRRRNDACGGGINGIVADAAPRRLPRNQPRDGVALRREDSPVLVNDLLRMYYRPVKVKPNTSPEYERFASALKTVLRVSHSELKAALEAEKKAKKRKQRRSKHAAASPGSGAGR